MTRRMDEALKVQAVLNRIDGADSENVCDQRAGRRAATGNTDSFSACLVGDLTRHEKITAKLQPPEGSKLRFQALFISTVMPLFCLPPLFKSIPATLIQSLLRLLFRF